MRTMLLLFLLAILPGMASPQQNPSLDQNKRSEDVVKRGEHVMGFSHEATTHHFRLLKDGGEISVTAKDPNDKASIEQIRLHLEHIVVSLSLGSEGVGPFDGKACLANLRWVRRSDAGELCADVVDDVEIAVRAIVVAQPKIGTE